MYRYFTRFIIILSLFVPLLLCAKSEDYSKNVKLRGQAWKNRYKIHIEKVPHIAQRSSNCVPATVAMILRYFDRTIGQNNLAKLFNTTKQGTNLNNMINAFQKPELINFAIKNQYSLTNGEAHIINKEYFKVLKNPSLLKNKKAQKRAEKLGKKKKGLVSSADFFGTIDRQIALELLPRVRTDLHKKFVQILQNYINAGIPVLWSVTMALDPKHPSSDNHMRVIIGYTVENDQVTNIIYRDSWRGSSSGNIMSFANALAMTKGLLLITPKGLDTNQLKRIKIPKPANRSSQTVRQ